MDCGGIKRSDMNVYGTEIEIVLGDIRKEPGDAFVLDGAEAKLPKEMAGQEQERGSVCIGPAKLKETKVALYAFVGTRKIPPDEESIRTVTYRALVMAEECHFGSLSFSALGTNGGFSAAACAKIIAQEAFRYLRTFKNPSLKAIRCVLSSKEKYMAFEKNVLGYLDYMVHKLSGGPYVTVDGIVEREDGIVMVERSNPPFGWALPGGFVDYDESVESAVKREVKEETHLDFKEARQFKVYSEPGRDPRFHTISVVFRGKGKGQLCAGSDAARAAVFKCDELPLKIAFDHKQIIEDYITYKKENSRY